MSGSAGTDDGEAILSLANRLFCLLCAIALTLQRVSALVERTMESELQALEDRIRQAADAAKRLRGENVDLRQRIVTLESDNRRLTEKVERAAQKIEALLKQMPE